MGFASLTFHSPKKAHFKKNRKKETKRKLMEVCTYFHTSNTKNIWENRSKEKFKKTSLRGTLGATEKF